MKMKKNNKIYENRREVKKKETAPVRHKNVYKSSLNFPTKCLRVSVPSLPSGDVRLMCECSTYSWTSVISRPVCASSE